MENGKGNDNNNDAANQEQNPTTNSMNNEVNHINDQGRPDVGGGSRRRTPFTDLSQVDADRALARTLQEQERAYMMLRDGSGYGSWESESYGIEDEEDDDFDDHSEEEYEGSELEDDDNAEEEDAFDVNAHDEEDVDDSQNVEIDPSAYSSDESYARALQDAEEREMAARLLAMAGINEMVVGEDEDEVEDDDDDEDEEDHGGNSQDAWEEVDLDELSYEELIALGDVVGTESRGLSADTIASLPSINYNPQSTQEGICDSCVICRLDYDEGDTLTVLSCKHSYHTECINNWLRINKACPVCSAEVSTSGNS